MLPSDMVVEIQAHGFDDIAASRIYALLTQANRRLCGSGPYPFLQKFSTWTESVGTAGAALTGAPADIRAVQAFGRPGTLENGGNIRWLSRNHISKLFGYNSYLIADYPAYYNLYGRNATGGMQLYVYPYITTATIFALDYFAYPPVLSAATTEAQLLLPDEFCPFLMDIVLARLSRSEGDLQDGDTYDNAVRVGISALQNAFDVNFDAPDPLLASEDPYFDYF